MKTIATKRHISVEEAMYRFAMDIGITPLCGTTNAARMAKDMKVPTDVSPLTDEELRECIALLR
ncbi:aldo-keto reductase, putative [Bodo saltans]|uniref:Aldo-keto reductase, putative n=1 Tax=Bodo saltans TaxID=75058 RepID=A0A0S4IYR6_BODSA|nr:aldo-keto reductase, putative [Bodo saltans]|eukprot:CUF79987.1 aldo-keto reductase, putative [Bodo saltans]